ncbi:MAG: type II toxin-antitoxin system RelE/ParE family toxin [Gemmatimonadetes bacterium]|nr:type II toxin-antitoxin system RelE/ParE family toxin [Gemmatimonadota bacterium]
MSESPLFWVGSSRDDLRTFSAEARRIAGHQLHRIQHGLDPADCKPMPSVGSGVYELRIRTRGAYRVFYVAKFAEGIYVLHAFRKKTQRTRKADIEIGRQRLRELHRHRRTRDRGSPNANQD